jgi:hypothetical protein
MIDVNIWLSTTVLFRKKITHGIFGPLCASESAGENVGHANLTMDINESSVNYEYIEAHFGKLNPKKTLSIIPAPAPSQINCSHLAPQTVKSYQFTHSMWPQGRASATSIFKKDTKRAFHIGKGKPGIEAQFNTHDNDMIREDIDADVHVVTHKKSSNELIQSEKHTNLEFISALSTLEVNFENVAKWENKLNQLQLEQVELMKHAEQNTTTYKNETYEHQMRISSNTLNLAQINRRLIALERTSTYLSTIQNMDPTTRTQYMAIQKQISNLKDEHELLIQDNKHIQQIIDELELIGSARATEINQELNNNTLATNYYIEALETALKEINGKTVGDLELMKEESRNRVDYTSRKEQFLLAKERTEGRHPDHIIKLPVTRDGWEYHLDEIKVLEAMEQERSNNYSFIFNNCATSVKRCILAGISQSLREHLMETGLKESFFHLKKIETCKGLRDWVRRLEISIIQLNFPPLAEQEDSVPIAASSLMI